MRTLLLVITYKAFSRLLYQPIDEKSYVIQMGEKLVILFVTVEVRAHMSDTLH